MQMWVVRHCGAPSVQYRSHTNPCSEMFWIGGDSQQRLGRSLEQQAIDRCLVLICNVGDLGWQREDNVEVLDRQQVLHARQHPVLRRSALTLRAVPIATLVVGDVLMITLGAGRDVTAEGSSATVLNGGHHLQLR